MLGTDIHLAGLLLKKEELVAIPTETVYGLAGNALSTKAVSNIFAVKNRPSFDPLIIHLSNFEQASSFVKNVPAIARDLAVKFMPGSLTLLLEKTERIPDLVTAGLSRVAVRIPRHPLTLKLLSNIDFPLAAPSANPFGYISPTTAQHVADQLGEKIPYILDGGPCKVGLESTIVGFEGDQIIIYRKGGIPVEAIEEVAGPVLVRRHSSSRPDAPGMLKSHYAPGAPVILGDLEVLAKKYLGKKIGVIAFQHPAEYIPIEHQLILSTKGSDTEAASKLFAGMRQLDKMDFDIIIAELVPEKGLGRAINDRLRRAGAEES